MKQIRLTNVAGRMDWLLPEVGEENIQLHGGHNEILVTSDGPQADFDLGYGLGKEEHREKPETFDLPNPYVGFLKQAILEYQKESYIHCTDEFRFDDLNIYKHEVSSEKNTTKITIYPQGGVHLFNIYARYGKLVEQNKK